jgi:HD-like signal output (HDOD) protein
MTAIQTLIREIRNLKPVPAVIHPLLEAVDRPDVDIGHIADIIQYDPALTASVLRTSNSAFFGLKRPAETIKDAVGLLGTDQVIDLVLIKSGVKALSGRQQGYDLQEGAMWKYSISSAIIARQIAEEIHIPISRPSSQPPCSRTSAKPCWTGLSKMPLKKSLPWWWNKISALWKLKKRL